MAGHVPAVVSVEDAASAGQRSIEHLRDEIEPFCSPGSDSTCAELVALFREEHTWQVPTLVAVRWYPSGDHIAFNGPGTVRRCSWLTCGGQETEMPWTSRSPLVITRPISRRKASGPTLADSLTRRMEFCTGYPQREVLCIRSACTRRAANEDVAR